MAMDLKKYLIFSIIILIALTILAGAHFFIYSTLVSWWHIKSHSVKTILAVVLMFLASSFIVSSVLAHYSSWLPVKVYYFLSGIWLALLTYLLITFALIKLLVYFFKLFNISFDTKAAVLVAILLSLSYVGYGIWNAYRPRFKNITAKINNLPSNWEGKKVVQLSDLHLGVILEKGFLRRIVDLVNTADPALVVITGDLLDGMEGNLDFGLEYLNQLKAEQGVYLVTGNHETYFGTAKFYGLLQGTQVKILNDAMVDLNGLQLIGLSYPERGESKDLVSAIKKQPEFDPGKPSILLYHSPVQVKEVGRAGINLQLSGHTHRGQLFPFNLIAKAIYRGFDYGWHRQDDYAIYTSSGIGVWGPTVRTASHPEIVVIKLVK